MGAVEIDEVAADLLYEITVEEGHHLRASAELVGREGRSVTRTVGDAALDCPLDGLKIGGTLWNIREQLFRGGIS